MFYDYSRKQFFLPKFYQYVPANTQGFLYVPNIRNSWNGIVPHLSSVLGGSKTTIAKEVQSKLSEIKDMLAGYCLFINEPEDLRIVGLDPGREFGFMLSIAESTPKILLALPVHDPELFRKRLGEISLPTGTIHLTTANNPDHSTQPATKYLVRETGHSAGGRLCSSTFLLDNTWKEISAKNNELTFVPDWENEGYLNIECKAILEDGSSRPCLCEADDEDFFPDDTRSTCETPFIVLPDTGKFQQALPINLDQRDQEIQKFDKSYLAFPQPGITLLSDDLNYLSQAVGSTTNNLYMNSNSNSLMRAASRFDLPYKTTDLRLVGGYRPPGVLGGTPLTMHARGNGSEIRFTFEAIPPRQEIELLNKLLTSTEKLPEVVNVPEASKASIFFNDSVGLDYIITFLSTHIEDFYDTIEEAIGNFTVVIRELENIEHIIGVGLHLVGLTNGVPELVLEMRFDTYEDSSDIEKVETSSVFTLLRNVQKKLRKERDVEIIKSAISESAFDENIDSYEDFLKYARPGIADEPASSYHLYSVTTDMKITSPEGGVPDTFFRNSQYEGDVSGISIKYLLPPVTENDLRYRFDNNDLSQEEQNDLKNNKNRLCATYRENTGQLFVATDRETLTKLLSDPQHLQEAALYREMRQHSPRSNQPKIGAFLRPDWLLDNGAVHPDDQVREWTAEVLRDLSQYDAMLITLDTEENTDGIVTVIELHRQ